MGNPVYKPRNTKRARALRHEASPAERRLWSALSNRKVGGCKFSRQMPIGPYFADFLCRERRLVVEIDGYSHDLRMLHDERRDQFIREAGYTVLRFTNQDVMRQLEGVIHHIGSTLTVLADAHPQPLPQAGGELK